MRRHFQFSQHQAFTVLELLVATALIGLISGLLLNAVNQSSNAWQAGQQAIERQRSARIALELISRDLSQAFSSRTSQPIHFFGFSTGAYYIAIIPTQDSRESDMGEVGYYFNAQLGKLYRYSTPGTNCSEFNPRADGSGSQWMWPGLTNSFLWTSEPDTLIAEGVVDCRFYYSGPITNNATTWTNSVDTWCTTNIVGCFQSDTLPAVVDVELVMMPPNKWQAPNQPSVAVYQTLTNQFSRAFSATVQVMRGGF